MYVPAPLESSSFLVDSHGVHDTVDRELVRGHLAEGVFFWLDLHRPGRDDLELLDGLFRFHPLAVEDADHFGQRPKIDPFGDFALIVAYGANEDQDGLVEVHCFFSEHFLVTVHRDSCPPFDDLRRRAAAETAPPAHGVKLLHLVLDALTDSFLPGLSALDDSIDELEDAVLQRPDDAQLQSLFSLKRRLVTWRKVITPQRDMLARLAGGVIELPGMTEDTQRYFRDVYDHLIRISDLIDSYRDLLTGAMDVYLSTVSNRLNETMKRLTIVATIFMPLTFIVGFFGMNFTWMVRQVTGFWPFFWLALVTQAVTIAVMLLWFRRQKWI
jgi:magnesium transporter